MRIKAKDLKGRALAWAVATLEGATEGWRSDGPFLWRGVPCISVNGHDIEYLPATDPTQGQPIAEREGISVIRCDDDYVTDAKGHTTTKHIPVWAATIGRHSLSEIYGSQGDNYGEAYTIDEDDVVYGSTPLEAAMRCRVIKALSTRNQWDLDLNAEIDIPEELC